METTRNWCVRRFDPSNLFFQEHKKKFQESLDLINQNNLNEGLNHTRICRINTQETVAESRTNLIECFNNIPLNLKEEVIEGKGLLSRVIEYNFKAIQRIDVSIEGYTRLETDLKQLSPEEIVRLMRESKECSGFEADPLNCNIVANFIQDVIENVNNNAFFAFADLCELASGSEFLTTVCFQHKIIVIVGLTKFLNVTYYLYKPGVTIHFLNKVKNALFWRQTITCAVFIKKTMSSPKIYAQCLGPVVAGSFFFFSKSSEKELPLDFPSCQNLYKESALALQDYKDCKVSQLDFRSATRNNEDLSVGVLYECLHPFISKHDQSKPSFNLTQAIQAVNDYPAREELQKGAYVAGEVIGRLVSSYLSLGKFFGLGFISKFFESWSLDQAQLKQIAQDSSKSAAANIKISDFNSPKIVKEIAHDNLFKKNNLKIGDLISYGFLFESVKDTTLKLDVSEISKPFADSQNDAYSPLSIGTGSSSQDSEYIRRHYLSRETSCLQDSPVTQDDNIPYSKFN